MMDSRTGEPEDRGNVNDMPPELRAALAALPREAPLLPGEEERTVRALRRQGMLPHPRWAGGRGSGWLRMIGQVAAALALFAGGALYGGERASRRALEAQLAQRDRDAQTTALLVQRAGSAWVDAVVRLAATSRAAPADPALARGREAALVSLRAAAGALTRMGVQPPLAGDACAAVGTAAPPAARRVYVF